MNKKEVVYKTVGGGGAWNLSPVFKDGHEFSESGFLQAWYQDCQTYLGSLLRNIMSWVPYRAYQVKMSEDGVRQSFLTSVQIVFMLTV